MPKRIIEDLVLAISFFLVLAALTACDGGEGIPVNANLSNGSNDEYEFASYQDMMLKVNCNEATKGVNVRVANEGVYTCVMKGSSWIWDRGACVVGGGYNVGGVVYAEGSVWTAIKNCYIVQYSCRHGEIREDGFVTDACSIYSPTSYAVSVSSSSQIRVVSSSSMGIEDDSLSMGIEDDSLYDDRDGQTYKTVVIGSQTWMAENLNYDPGQGGSGEDKYDWSWCYGNDEKKCTKYGRLYTWAAAIDSVKLASDDLHCGYNKGCGFGSILLQGICPTGWHLPSQDEWNELITAVDGELLSLKFQSGWYDNAAGYPDYWYGVGIGDDAVGFSALPAGYRNYGGGYYRDGEKAMFWSSTESSVYYAYSMSLPASYKYVYDYDDKRFGYSVRCLRD